jgi:MoxR-like ATPase
MQHFSVVQSIVRAALSGDQLGVRKQVARLKERLAGDGDEKDVAALDRLLASIAETHDMAPSRVEVSRMMVTGETLTAQINPPIDRETGARLCTIDFPSSRLVRPVYNASIADSIEGLLAEWRDPQSLRELDVDPSRSLLIYGPPGAGKTLTAHYIAGRLGLPLLTARIDGLISSFLGTTARNIANLFDFANRYACILLLDEFDAIAKVRDDPHEVGEIKRVVNTLLQNLDMRRTHALTIAITNHDRLLDPAVWRRFETQISLEAPEAPAREQMIERFLQPIHTEKPILRIFSYCLEGRSGSDLESMCASVKRSLALSGDARTAPGLFVTLSNVLARTPDQAHPAARVLAEDREAFVSLIANDAGIGLTQIEIGEATGLAQSRVSELKKAKRYTAYIGASHA